jgi:hypothetical protein
MKFLAALENDRHKFCSQCKFTELIVLHYRGIARHCNYLGDLLLALSFSLPCGARWLIIFLTNL